MQTQALDLFTYFSGQTRAYGLFEDRFGRIRRSFTVDIQGRVEGPELVLEEHFLYDDGNKELRVWRIRQQGEGIYRGRAEGVVGEASGLIRENHLRWHYRFDLPLGQHKLRVKFDDQMLLMPDQILLNRARVSKWGLTLGQVTLSFCKPEPG
ncbi:DUF3833 family protein [Neptuniibacter halophilus]|uniref:DUF3833 family protein n=1 Tax=Neptuniibacter halophilus TaxID=651666 RepID=UPI0025735B7F|nr:DUF3833 family protein [Neptuniibacter halophilus]